MTAVAERPPVRQRRNNGPLSRRNLVATLTTGYLPIVLATLVVVMPLLWMVLASFKTPGELLTQHVDLLRIMNPLGRGTNTLIYESYLQAFGSSNRAGYSATISTVLFGLLVVLTVFQLVVLERRVHYR